MSAPEFKPFPKLARLQRGIVITEKLDGTNAQVVITPEGEVFAGSRTRYITPEADNAGFARWVKEHEDELRQLGQGQHFGEWWGAGIQRRYGLEEKRFSLFNTSRWLDGNLNRQPSLPACCGVVPVLYHGPFNTAAIDSVMEQLRVHGSFAAPGFMQPEGIVVYHAASGMLFKRTFEHDEKGKGATP